MKLTKMQKGSIRSKWVKQFKLCGVPNVKIKIPKRLSSIKSLESKTMAYAKLFHERDDVYFLIVSYDEITDIVCYYIFFPFYPELNCFEEFTIEKLISGLDHIEMDTNFKPTKIDAEVKAVCDMYKEYGIVEFDDRGYNRWGYDIDGRDKDGYDEDGLDKDGIARSID